MFENLAQKTPKVNAEVRRMADEILASPYSTAWERKFAGDILEWRGNLTPRQLFVFHRVWNQRCAPRRGAPLEECSRDWVSGRYRLAPPMRRASMRRRING